ncbi:Inositol 2-dehydrogenase/D-chiro-inositol 3-dehydrogenase [Neolewinella maritima]|uniref:Inositol 2-dehydrogenase/D-chiro-inositol 3-dehydrogenase n=1 Tax=Neolewinella maritima TaxID=1383882 RepID=A0ABM9AX61_9BACT|nr:Gfo/Idh/MocA family oxidoreductase [Neolewinella maritima]CAH0999319.1 Inositol 2-dehydrogenase/D-chiro-inositol 3-dehydrogenase [Neolewinella maritima]
MDRRTFLQTSPALFALPLTAHPRPRPVVRRVALIGCGWYGKSDLMRLLQVAEVEVVGLCDVDRQTLEGAAALLKERQPTAKPGLYADYREMLRQTRPGIVLIATPDHWHALQAIAAMEVGAHVYLQKPVGVDLRECAAVLEAARRHDRVVQVGLQRRSTPHLVQAKRDIVETGLLGTIGHVELCCYYHMRDTAVREVEPVPDFFDYDAWTGPAPLLPYRGLPHRRWRSFQAYGNGIVGDMCVHMLDMTRWMLDLGWPDRVASTGGIRVQTAADATTTDTQTVVFDYPEFSCVWQHRSWGPPVDEDFPWAMTLYGAQGVLRADPYKYDFSPHDGETVRVEAVYERDAFPEDLTEPDIELHTAPATRAHMADFLQAIDTGGRPVADIAEGMISTAACILGNLALEAGHPLAYDPVARAIVPEHPELLARTYRPPYQHP